MEVGDVVGMMYFIADDFLFSWIDFMSMLSHKFDISTIFIVIM